MGDEDPELLHAVTARAAQGSSAAANQKRRICACVRKPVGMIPKLVRSVCAVQEKLADDIGLIDTLRLGRTDPNLDPQGVGFIEMLMLAQKQYNLPSDIVTKIIGGPPSSANSSEIFDETALEPRLQAGQLDASSAYLSQAVQLHLHYITLPSSINLGDPALAAQYKTVSFKLANGQLQTGKPLSVCITTIGTKDQAAADAFVTYVLSPAGLALHKQGGYTLLTPKAFGNTSAIPASVKSELGG